MKQKKKSTIIRAEERIATHRKTITHNASLAEKNTELSQKLNLLEKENRLLKMNGYRFILYKIKHFINYLKKLYYEKLH